MGGIYSFIVFTCATASLSVYAAPSILLGRDTTIPGLDSAGCVSSLVARPAHANRYFSVSQGCQNTLTSLISSPAATCLNIPGTVAILSTVANSRYAR